MVTYISWLTLIKRIRKVKGLITNYNILDKEDLKIGNTIKVSFGDDEYHKEIIIDKDRKIYTSKAGSNVKIKTLIAATSVST